MSPESPPSSEEEEEMSESDSESGMTLDTASSIGPSNTSIY